MDMLGPGRLDMPRHGAKAGEGNPDFGIGRHRQRPEALGRQEGHGMPCPGQFAADAFERPDHAIDLRSPRIGDDEDAAAFSSDERMGHAGTARVRLPGQSGASPSRCREGKVTIG
jgi:hypothetical protein